MLGLLALVGILVIIVALAYRITPTGRQKQAEWWRTQGGCSRTFCIVAVILGCVGILVTVFILIAALASR